MKCFTLSCPNDGKISKLLPNFTTIVLCIDCYEREQERDLQIYKSNRVHKEIIEWIKPEDKMPDVGEPIMAMIGTGTIKTLKYIRLTHGGWKYTHDDNNDIYIGHSTVVYWARYPKGPKIVP